MIIKSITLNNIRSYTNQTIYFPEGIILLSGDIGSGKSTILLAIEFALFGILRGDLSGSSLLRHGCSEGSVKLEFEINEIKYKVERSLKRSKSVEQGVCIFSNNDIHEKLTPLELKSRILQILGYPEELLTKSKSLIYRYTIYTPQENMKNIITDSHEERLKILRTVFDMEKYQRITDNSNVFCKSLRYNIKRLEGYTTDLDIKKSKKTKLISEQKDLENELNKVSESLEKEKDSLNKLQSEKLSLEEDHNRYVEVQSKLRELERLHSVFENDLKELKTEKATLLKKLEDFEDVKETSKNTEQIIKLIEEKNLEQNRIKNDLNQKNSLKGQFFSKRSDAQSLAKKIHSINNCPTCFQEVQLEHKQRIINEQKSVIKDIFQQEKALNDQIQQLEAKHKLLLKEVDHLRNDLEKVKLNEVKIKGLIEYKKLVSDKDKKIEDMENKILENGCLIEDLKSKVNKSKNIVEIFNKKKSDFDSQLQKERSLAIKVASLQGSLSEMKKVIDDLLKEINDKELAKLNLEKSKETNSWFETKFIPLMSEIERHVFMKIKEEFSDYFTDAFSTLVEDNLMTARLDDSFTPIITQNGYDTDLNFLSGGEKTACALAYRLALNKTINILLNTINTKDLLILDEPTDGFSDEQLDKMRDVLENINLKQIIIVSHEQKMESFVDSLIKVEKENHQSNVTQI